MLTPTVDFDDTAAEAKRAYLRDTLIRHGVATFVETGTSEGHTVAALVGVAERIISIELGDAKYIQSSMQFLDEPSVKLLHGDSDRLLERLVQVLDPAPALFWLDAHMTEADGVPASTPIRRELEHILYHRGGRDFIYVDDLDLFETDPAYPTLSDLYDLVERYAAPLRIGVEREHNLVYLVPA